MPGRVMIASFAFFTTGRTAFMYSSSVAAPKPYWMEEPPTPLPWPNSMKSTPVLSIFSASIAICSVVYL